VVDASEQVYFVDFTRDRILKFDTAGKLSVFADGAKADLFYVPHHLFISREGNIYTASDRQGKIVRIAPDGKMAQVYPPTDWYGIDFFGSGGDPFAVDAAGNIYGINRRQFKVAQVLRVTPEGRIEALAGGALGHADGNGAAARFGEAHSMVFACGTNRDLFVSDRTAIRRIQADGTVSTLAGSGEAGDRDGRGSEARFTALAGISFDAQGTLWAADPGTGKIRAVTSNGVVNTFSFSNDPRLSADGRVGSKPEAPQRPLRPVGVAVGASGQLYALDYPTGDDPRLSRIDRNGQVTVLAVVTSDLPDVRR
jgi:secreted PhoX family phosphatase